MNLSFRLRDNFVGRYAALPEPFGFNGVGAVTYYRTYARPISDNTLESWHQACERVINGMYSIQKDYCKARGIPWDDEKAHASASEAYDRMFRLKWSPPGRGIFHMGAASIHERGMYEALDNCAFISTENIDRDGGSILAWIMEMLMLGVGVGSDMRGVSKRMFVAGPNPSWVYTFVVPDSREGWAESLKVLFDSYFMDYGKPQNAMVKFDYSKVRPKGSPIRGFGGVSSGPEPLMWMHETARRLLDENIGRPLAEKTLADIINLIGCVVVAGNVRRSSEILLGSPDSEVFANLKNENMYPDRGEWSWASNNSVLGRLGMDYSQYAGRILDNGEPGFLWLENVNRFGRMNGVLDNRDIATGVNPCGEQPLEGSSVAGVGGELCTLVELYPARHTSKYDLLRSIKFAYLYGKTVTLLSEDMSHAGTREIMSRNRRIGLSMTGVTQFMSQHNMNEVIDWLETGYEYVRHYDKRYSAWLGVPESVRVTSVKPSGTVSLLAGATPGVHFPHYQSYIRRMRISDNSYLVDRLMAAGVPIEPDVKSPNTLVAEFPVFVGDNIRSAKAVSMYEQLAIAAMMQRHWSDNSVSVTVSIDPEKYSEADVAAALDHYQYQLKSVSLLPEMDGGAYEQMPYEAISLGEYRDRASRINYDLFSTLSDTSDGALDRQRDVFCDGEACAIPN